MISNAVKERLLQKNWYFKCQTKKDANLLLQACNDAGITWAQGGEKPTELYPYESYPFDIGFFEKDVGITHDYYNIYEKYELENITDWFFNAIQDTDGKLTPQNAEQEHYVQMLLAKMQGIPVEFWYDFDQIWDDSSSDSISISVKYRIKSKPTPLPISREIWSHLDKRWQYAAMDEDGRIFFYNTKPTREFEDWSASSDMSDCPLNINAYGINWETSLTERPEDV